MLIDLCHNTEPDVDKLNGHKTNHIFSAHTIDAHELYRKTKQEYGYNDHFEVGTIMKQANMIWKLRKRWEAADENNQQKDYSSCVIFNNSFHDFFKIDFSFKIIFLNKFSINFKIKEFQKKCNN